MTDVSALTREAHSLRHASMEQLQRNCPEHRQQEQGFTGHACLRAALLLGIRVAGLEWIFEFTFRGTFQEVTRTVVSMSRKNEDLFKGDIEPPPPPPFPVPRPQMLRSCC